MSDKVTKKWLRTLENKRLIEVFETVCWKKHSKQQEKELRYCEEELLKRLEGGK